MDKKNKLIISIGICIIIAATVLIISLVDGMADDEPTGYSGMYTLQPTTQPTVAPNTSSWVDLNLIASELASVTDTSNASTTGPSITAAPMQGYFFDMHGNLVDGFGNVIVPANQIGNNQGDNNQGGNNNQTFPNLDNTPSTTIDSTQALDVPVTEDGGTFGEFEVDEKGVITKYLGDKEDIMIPTKEQGKIITGIGDGCFKNSTIRSIYIPDTVVYIGNFAFENCTRLSTISFVSSDTQLNVGTGAFQNCFALTTIDLPVVTILGNSAFGNCTALKTVRFNEGSKKIGSYAFSNCPELTTVVIPVSVDEMGTGVFEGSNNTELCIVSSQDSTAWEYAVNAGKKVNTHE